MLPISVPDSSYCWEGHNPCENFDNEGGHGRCLLELGLLNPNKEGIYLKPIECLRLEEVAQ